MLTHPKVGNPKLLCPPLENRSRLKAAVASVDGVPDLLHSLELGALAGVEGKVPDVLPLGVGHGAAHHVGLFQAPVQLGDVHVQAQGAPAYH